jgi:predicted phosphodiesterase
LRVTFLIGRTTSSSTTHSNTHSSIIFIHELPEMSSQEQSQTPSSITIVALSDSHSCHPSLRDLPLADVLIHTGDSTQHGTKEELQDVITWLATLPCKNKVVIAGNHDIGLDKDCTYRSALASRAGTYATPEETDSLITTMKQQGITYLSPENSLVELHNRGTTLEIYGLPYSPLSIGPSAFMRSRSEDTWADIHGYYDILLSHSPPRGYLDRNRAGEHVGCEHFLSAIRRVRPAVAVFGHVHEARGQEEIEWGDGAVTRLYNVAVMNRDQTLSPPTVFRLPAFTTSPDLGDEE